jgi:hypothetical protein
MDRIDLPRTFSGVQPSDPADETVINGAPYDAGKTSGGPAAAGTPAYPEQYMRDHGPDLDESLDGTESGQEI